MKTVGQLLREARKKQNRPLSNIARETKISARFLKALENDDFDKLPPEPFVKGFIKNYTQVVGLSTEKVLAAFRRDFAIDKEGKIAPKSLSKPIADGKVFGPRLLKFLAVSLVVLLFSAYLGFQLKSFFAPPSLTVFKPENRTQLKGPVVSVEGRASIDTSVWVNDQLVEIDSLGLWRKKLELLPGENKIEVKAVNRRDKETKEEIVVEVVDN